MLMLLERAIRRTNVYCYTQQTLAGGRNRIRLSYELYARYVRGFHGGVRVLFSSAALAVFDAALRLTHSNGYAPPVYQIKTADINWRGFGCVCVVVSVQVQYSVDSDHVVLGRWMMEVKQKKAVT